MQPPAHSKSRAKGRRLSSPISGMLRLAGSRTASSIDCLTVSSAASEVRFQVNNELEEASERSLGDGTTDILSSPRQSEKVLDMENDAEDDMSGNESDGGVRALEKDYWQQRRQAREKRERLSFVVKDHVRELEWIQWLDHRVSL